MRAAGLGILAVLLIASSAGATEFHYGAEVKGIYNSNLFGSAHNVEDDGSFRGTPFIGFQDPDGSFRWNFEYDPSYEQFVTHTDLSGWDQDVHGGFTWHLAPTADLNISDHFGRFRSLTRFNQTVGVPGGGTALESFDQRRPFIQNSGSISLDLHLSPTQTLTFFGDDYFWDYSNKYGRDQQTIDAGLSYLRSVTTRLRLGTTLTWTHQYLAPFGVSPSQATDYYHVGGDIIYVVDPTLQIQVSAGPTLLIPPSAPSNIAQSSAFVRQIPLLGTASGTFLVDATTCPTLSDGTPYFSGRCGTLDGPLTSNDVAVLDFLFPPTTVFFNGSQPSGGGNELTYFADASITKAWRNWTFTLSYQRRANQAGGAAVASNLNDIVYGHIHWHPAERWNVDVDASWINRQQQGSFVQTVLGVRPFALTPTLTTVAQSASLGALLVTNAVSTTTWNASMYVGYQLTRRIRVFGYGGWTQNQTSGSFLPSATVNLFTFWTGVRYEFEPIRF